MLAKHKPHNTHWVCGVSRESRSVAGWTWCSCCLLSPSAHCDSDQDYWHGKNTQCRIKCSHMMCVTSVERVCVYVTLLGLGAWYRRRDLCSVQWLWRLFSEESKGKRGTRNYEKMIHKNHNDINDHWLHCLFAQAVLVPNLQKLYERRKIIL